MISISSLFKQNFFNIASFIIISLTPQMASSQIKIRISNGYSSISAELIENKSSENLLQKLPLTISFNPYGGFEYVGALGFSLPSSDQRITTNAGDIMLYNSINIVIFYGKNTWEYTPLGKISEEDISKIRTFFEENPGAVTISLDYDNVKSVNSSNEFPDGIYDIHGRKIDAINDKSGIYIVDKKKFLKK